MAVNIEKIRLFVTNLGYIIGEDTAKEPETPVATADGMLTGMTLISDFVTLNHPLRLVPIDDGRLSVAAILMKEEWVTFSRASALEIDVAKGLADLYCEYEQKIHGSIILPSSGSLVV